MNIHYRLQLGLALLVALVGCAPDTKTTAPRTSALPAPSEPSPTPTVQDIMQLAPARCELRHTAERSLGRTGHDQCVHFAA
jgi:hypothetical protein